MASYRVLIVDDQTDTRRMLRIGVQSLGPDFTVLDMPSGEEALLELTRQPADLLITDIRLAGMSGLELVAKAHRHNPKIKIFLITALTDSLTRRQADESEVSAFFPKPLDLPDFLDAVERELGVVKTHLPPPPVLLRETQEEPLPPVESLPEQLSRLRKDLAASAVVLLEDGGQALAQAGELPEAGAQFPGFLSPLMAAFSASTKVSHALGSKSPRSLLFFPGSRYSLCMAHITATCALLAVTGPGDVGNQAILAGLIDGAIPELQRSLARMGISQGTLQNPPTVPEGASGSERDEPTGSGDDREVKRIFREYTHKPDAGDLDQFWDTAAEQNETNGLGDGGAITYEQAKKLGLAPEE